MNAVRPPVLIIGMHRSGTSMVARMLEGLGLFQGWRKQGDHESLFFLGLNDWLLRQSGGAWDHPEPIEHLLRHTDLRALAADYLLLSLRAPRCLSYLGPRHYLRFRSPLRLPFPWGWKDPRTTFTLPLWLDLFPEARVVHIFRHGVDVAQSLKSRDEQILRRRTARYRRLRPLYSVYSKRIGFVTSPRCASLEEGLTLWELYMDRARSHVHTLGERALDIRYEDMLADPHSHLERLARFCGLDATSTAIQSAAGRAQPQRAFAYRRSHPLRVFAERFANRLGRFDS